MLTNNELCWGHGVPAKKQNSFDRKEKRVKAKISVKHKLNIASQKSQSKIIHQITLLKITSKLIDGDINLNLMEHSNSIVNFKN